MSRSTVVMSVAIALAVLALVLAYAFGGHEILSTTELREAAQREPDRPSWCAKLRGSLAPQTRISFDEVKQRLEQKAQGRVDLRFANLIGQKLDNMDFSGADMRFADLSDASLEGAQFNDTDLSCANLSLAHGRASFRAALMTGAELIEADLQKSAFDAAQLDRADLSNAVLKEANLRRANLTFARLLRTDLEKASLAEADLRLADYRPANAPLATALKNLEQTYPHAPEFTGLSAIRKGLIDLGESTQARNVTYAIEAWRDEHRLLSARRQGCLQSIFVRLAVGLRRVAFDWTVAYGASPRRALLAFMWLILAFAAVYWTLIETRFNTGAHGLFRVTPKGALIATANGVSETADTRVERVRVALAESIPAALWFSVLSATRFGYGSFTLSSWLTALQPGQDEYRALGLFRALAGVQGLLSLYLLVLFVVTLFGDPFSLWP
jgi:uncharacterized protein YjbI with pentapeptide repeats